MHSFDKHAAYRFSRPPSPPPHLIYTKTAHSHQKRVFIPTTNTKPMNKAKEMSMVMSLGLQICFFFISFSFLLTKNLDTIWAIDYDNDGMAGRGQQNDEEQRNTRQRHTGLEMHLRLELVNLFFHTLTFNINSQTTSARSMTTQLATTFMSHDPTNHLNTPNHIKMAVAARAQDTACFKP